MTIEGWYLVIGLLLLLIAVVGGLVARWPLTTAMMYLGLGALFWHLGWIALDLARDAHWLALASEIAVIVSLFSAGLKLRLPLTSRSWLLPVALATTGMAATAALVASAGVLWLGLPLGAAVLLGAILAPTDPVLAADVKVGHTGDTDPVRLTLTGEAGMNDGTAFPVLMLGLGLLGLHTLGDGAMRWLTLDVLWMVFAGLLVGGTVGAVTAHLVLMMRRRFHEALGFDDFLSLGVIATAYGLAHATHAYGFLAVFAAGWAMRAVERRERGATAEPLASHQIGDKEMAANLTEAPAYLAEAVLRFNEHMDRIGELTLVLFVGALLATMAFDWQAVGFALLLIVVIRPLCVLPLCALSGMRPGRAVLVSWFGIRGIGSVYYLAYAVTHGLPEHLVGPIAAIVLTTIGISTFVHGMSSTPLMRLYGGDGAAWMPWLKR